MVSKSNFSVELEQKLIDGVRDHLCLWDKSNENYKNVRSKEAAWKQVAKIVFGHDLLSEEDPILAVDGKRAKEIWCKSLRPQYMRFRKRVELPTGSAANRKPYFRHEESMKFLVETLEPDEETFTNIDLATNQSESQFLGDDEFSLQLVDEGFPPSQVDSDIRRTQGQTLNSTPVMCSTSTVLVPRERSHTKFNGKRRRLDEFDNELLKIMSAGVKEEDEFDVFGKSIAQKLRKLETRKSAETQFKIFSLIHEVEMDYLNSQMHC